MNPDSIDNKTKLHLGCGHNIKPGWINHDLVDLPGVDLVFDLEKYPWPINDKTCDEIIAKDVLEHLSNTVKVMDEFYRITKPGAKIYIAVPYWNSWEAITDPTHVSQFNEYTFEFFDPNKSRCKNRPYYSKARFNIKKIGYGISFLMPRIYIPFISRYFIIYNPLLKWVIGFFAQYFNNIIIGLEVFLERDE